MSLSELQEANRVAIQSELSAREDAKNMKSKLQVVEEQFRRAERAKKDAEKELDSKLQEFSSMTSQVQKQDKDIKKLTNSNLKMSAQLSSAKELTTTASAEATEATAACAEATEKLEAIQQLYNNEREAHEKTAEKLLHLEQLSGNSSAAAEYEQQKSVRAKEALQSERDAMARQIDIAEKIKKDLEHEVARGLEKYEALEAKFQKVLEDAEKTDLMKSSGAANLMASQQEVSKLESLIEQITQECVSAMETDGSNDMAQLGALECVRRLLRQMQRGMDTLAHELRSETDTKCEVDRQIRLVQHELEQTVQQRQRMSERCQENEDKARAFEDSKNQLKNEIANARMEAAEFADSKSGLSEIVATLRSKLREATNEIGLVRREVTGVVISGEQRTVAELVADQRGKLRETEEELATVSRELQSVQRQGNEVRDQHEGAVGRVTEMEQKLERLENALSQVSLECADVLMEKIDQKGPVELVRRTIRQLQRNLDTLAHDLRTAENGKSEVERQMRLVQHEVIQATDQRQKMSERSQSELDRVRGTEEDLSDALTEISNARMEAAEFGSKDKDLVEIVAALRSKLREATNEIGLVRREVTGVVISGEQRTVAELVADQRGKLREKEEELATVSRELQSVQRQWNDLRDQHNAASERVTGQRDELYHSSQMIDEARTASESLKADNVEQVRLLKVAKEELKGAQQELVAARREGGTLSAEHGTVVGLVTEQRERLRDTGEQLAMMHQKRDRESKEASDLTHSLAHEIAELQQEKAEQEREIRAVCRELCGSEDHVKTGGSLHALLMRDRQRQRNEADAAESRLQKLFSEVGCTKENFTQKNAELSNRLAAQSRSTTEAQEELHSVRRQLESALREGGELSAQHRSTVDMVADQRERLRDAEEELQRVDNELRGTQVYTASKGEYSVLPPNLGGMVAKMRDRLVDEEQEVMRLRREFGKAEEELRDLSAQHQNEARALQMRIEELMNTQKEMAGQHLAEIENSEVKIAKVVQKFRSKQEETTEQLAAAAQKACSLEGATIAEVSQLRLQLQEYEVQLQSTILERNNRSRQLEVLLDSTVEWEHRVEASDMEYQAMSAALADEKRKSSQMRRELIAAKSLKQVRNQVRHKQAPMSGVGITFNSYDEYEPYDHY